MKTVFKNATVLPVSGPAYVGDVAVENGKIAEMGASLSAAGCECVDCTGKYVLPGFVDAHSHIGLQETGSREIDHNEKGTPCTPHMRAIDAIFPMDPAFETARKLGITTVVTGPGSINLIGGTFAAVKPRGNTVEKMLLRDGVAMKMAMGENPKFRYTEMGKHPRTRMGIAAIIREEFTKAINYRNSKAAGTLKDINLEMEAMQPVLDGRMPMKIHCHRADDIMTAIRIMNEFGIRYTLDHCTEGYMIADELHEAIGNGGCNGIIMGPVFNFGRKLECRFKLGTDNATALYEKGLPFAIMTDFPDSTLDCLRVVAAIAVGKGLPEDEALRAITLRAAEITGIGDRVGSLEPGKDADIAVWSGHPFDYRSNVCATYIDGVQVY